MLKQAHLEGDGSQDFDVETMCVKPLKLRHTCVPHISVLTFLVQSCYASCPSDFNVIRDLRQMLMTDYGFHADVLKMPCWGAKEHDDDDWMGTYMGDDSLAALSVSWKVCSQHHPIHPRFQRDFIPIIRNPLRRCGMW